jgi:uncharacterized surface protein with fasciclin (FAS1) repeats
VLSVVAAAAAATAVGISFFFLSLSLSQTLLLPLSLPPPHPPPPPTPPTPTTALSKNREYSDLKQLVDKAGLAGELGPSFSGTVLAPNNAAFDAVARAGGPKVSDFLGGSPADLKKLLLFHVLSEKLTPSELTPDMTLETRLPGARLALVAAPGGKGGVQIKPASYNGAPAGPAGPDVTAGNAALLPLNRILAPSKADIQASI